MTGPAPVSDATAARMGLAKKYGPWYIWGQLHGWFKQTVYDPTASLSADRRGTVSLPDIESCYAPLPPGTAASLPPRPRYTLRDRTATLDHIAARPDAMWRVGTLWSFRNEAKIYGSPWFDGAWAGLTGEFPDPVPGLLASLRSAPVPYGSPAAAAADAADKARGKAAVAGAVAPPAASGLPPESGAAVSRRARGAARGRGAAAGGGAAAESGGGGGGGGGAGASGGAGTTTGGGGGGAAASAGGSEEPAVGGAGGVAEEQHE